MLHRRGSGVREARLCRSAVVAALHFSGDQRQRGRDHTFVFQHYVIMSEMLKRRQYAFVVIILLLPVTMETVRLTF